MADYIDRTKVFDAITVELYPSEWNEIIENIANIPSVDAVEVVRCKDCQHSCIDENWCECRLLEIGVDEDFYCADGIRKEVTG